MNKVVYEYDCADYKLTISGNNEGREAAYLERIGKQKTDCSAFVSFVTPSGVKDHLPCFYETRYFVRCDFKSEAHVRDAHCLHKMASVADAFSFMSGTLVGTLDFVNAPGKFQFAIGYDTPQGEKRDVFEWWVVSEKLDVANDYAAIVGTIENAVPGLVHAFLAKGKGKGGLVPTDKTEDAIWAEIFQEVAEKYEKSCDWITHQPHRKYVPRVEYLRADRIKRWTPQLANRFVSLPDDRKSVAALRTEYIDPEVDTVENRFVKFTLGAIAKRLRKFAALCNGHKTVSEGFVNSLTNRADAFNRIERGPFFRTIGRFTGFRQESIALQRKQGYAEVYAIWLQLQKALDATQEGFDMGHRPISALYEFWCFLMMAEDLENLLSVKPEGRLEGARTSDDLFEEPDPDRIDSKTLSALTYTWKNLKDGLSIKLLYQQEYGVSRTDEGFAYYNPQRPDIVLVLEKPDGEVYTYLFDAKYRIDSRNQGDNKNIDAAPPDPINDMHRYRDAILYRKQGDKKLSRQIVGAYVLYPGRPSPHSYDYSDLIAHENIGAIPLLPGVEGGTALKSFIGEILGKKTKDDHLGDGKVIATRGTTVIVGDGIALDKAMNGEFIPTITLNPNEWPSVSDKSLSVVKVPNDHVSKILPPPSLVRLRANNHAEIIVKLLPNPIKTATHQIYNIEWTTSGVI